MTTDPLPPSEDAPEAGQDAGQPLDTKARFRAALERKRQRRHAGAAGVTGDPKTPHSRDGAGGQRMFRRKSG